ncbi:MAG: hypothetical protein E7520_05495 [Ruminococcaceae bacterium]|nr:hypothetical protein [Oscillospiraceae bacterium]
MKKILSLLLCAVLLAGVTCGFAGCAAKTEINEKNITAAVEKTAAALQEFDTKTLGKYVDSKTLGVIIPVAEKNEAFLKLGTAMFVHLTVEIVRIDVDAATVTVKVNNKDLYADASAFAYELNSHYSKMELLGLLNNQSFIDENLNPLIEKIEAAPMKSEAQEITLKVTQGKRNLVLGFDDAAEDAVSGGALGAIKSVFGV